MKELASLFLSLLQRYAMVREHDVQRMIVSQKFRKP
jgi:hypothetical protein